MKRIITTSMLCLTIGFAAAGCGGSDEPAASDATQAASQQSTGGRSPGGSGEVVDVSGSTAQVKGQDSQVAVTWNDSTTFTKQVDGSAGDIEVGSCVMVTPAEASSSTDTVAAASVRITEVADGECSMGGGGGMRGGGGRPDGGTPPDGDAPPAGAVPDGLRPDNGAVPRSGVAVGEVTAVTDAGFTVASQRPDADADATSVEVTTSGDTTYTKTAKASSSDISVGVCVTSRGESDDTGAITATSIAVAAKVDGECSSMGGFRGGPGGGRPSDASTPAARADAA